MMFADFGQWRAVWQQRGKALVRKRSTAPEPQAAAQPPAGVSTALDAVASRHPQGSLPTDFGLPQGWVWGADGVKDTAAAGMTPSDHPQHEPMEAACDPQRAGEPPTPERLRMAGAI